MSDEGTPCPTCGSIRPLRRMVCFKMDLKMIEAALDLPDGVTIGFVRFLPSSDGKRAIMVYVEGPEFPVLLPGYDTLEIEPMVTPTQETRPASWEWHWNLKENSDG